MKPWGILEHLCAFLYSLPVFFILRYMGQLWFAYSVIPKINYLPRPSNRAIEASCLLFDICGTSVLALMVKIYLFGFIAIDASLLLVFFLLCIITARIPLLIYPFFKAKHGINLIKELRVRPKFKYRWMEKNYEAREKVRFDPETEREFVAISLLIILFVISIVFGYIGGKSISITMDFHPDVVFVFKVITIAFLFIGSAIFAWLPIERILEIEAENEFVFDQSIKFDMKVMNCNFLMVCCAVTLGGIIGIQHLSGKNFNFLIIKGFSDRFFFWGNILIVLLCDAIWIFHILLCLKEKKEST